MVTQMHVVFHIGLNKAGSTYLQDALTFNKERLAERGIAYPGAPAVSVGQSSTQGGNGPEVTYALRDRNAGHLADALGALVSKAGAADTLLISNESAYHQLVDRERLSMLLTAFDTLGFDDARLVVIFRNVYTHAISAYSHRAGSHGASNRPMPDFSTWIRPGDLSDSMGASGTTVEATVRRPFTDVYEFWSEFPRFAQRLTEIGDRAQFEFLRQESDILRGFGTLLGVRLEPPGKPRSNVSMNLLEAELARQLLNVSPEVVRAYRRLAKETPSDCKTSDQWLRNAYYDEIEKNLPDFHAELDVLREHFGNSAATILDRPATSVDVRNPLERPLGLSDKQVESLIRSIRVSARNRRMSVLKGIVPRPLKTLGKRLLRR